MSDSKFFFCTKATGRLGKEDLSRGGVASVLAFLLWLAFPTSQPLQAQGSDLPAGAQDNPPNVSLPTPLGAGAGAGAPATRVKPIRPPSTTDADSTPLPTAESTSSVAPGTASSRLFGNGAETVPGLTRRVPYSFTLSLNGVYDDNTTLSRGGSGSDGYLSIAPTFTLGLDNLVSAKGNYLHFVYSPVVSLYFRSGENDSVQHLIGLESQYRFGQFAVSFRQDVQILDGTDTAATSAPPGAISLPGQTAGSNPIYSTGAINQVNLDVSARSQLNIFNTTLNVAYSYSDKTSLNTGLQYSANVYSDLISSQNLAGNLYADYHYSLKTNFGLGLSGGHSFVEEPSPDQNFLQINTRANYRYSDSLSFAGSLGLEFRESDGQSGVDLTPVFELSANFRPVAGTLVTLAATRSQQSSAVLVAQNFETTSVSLSLQQLINSRLSANLALSFQNAHYVSEAAGISADRDENYFTVSPSLNFLLRPGVTINVFYVHRQNSSSGAVSRSFSNNQAGLGLTLTF